MRRFALLLMIPCLLADVSSADEKLKGIACRSVHLGYPGPVATAFYNEARVERSSDGTYFMVCGWSKGYFGIQELADGKKLVLFSVWDPTSGDDPAKVPEEKRVKLLHKDAAVRVGRFGNEGTGGQSFFDYDWRTGTTYRFLVTAKPDGAGRTAYTGHFFIPEKKEWKRLVTFSTPTPENENLLRGHYSFVEDFRRNKISATKTRRAEFGNGWLKTTEGKWTAIDSARFTGDANPVLNIDAGAAQGDAKANAPGARFFLATGGKLVNKTTKLNETIQGEKPSDNPPDDLPNID